MYTVGGRVVQQTDDWSLLGSCFVAELEFADVEWFLTFGRAVRQAVSSEHINKLSFEPFYVFGSCFRKLETYTKPALLSVLVNRFLLTENEGSTCPYRGPSTSFAIYYHKDRQDIDTRFQL